MSWALGVVLASLLILAALWRWGGWLVAHLLPWLLRRTPPRARALFAKALGDLMRSLGIRREVARANLARAFPELPDARREELLREFYRHLGGLVVEFLQVPSMSSEEIDEAVELDAEAFA